jgi:hypothetical protein
MKHFGFVLSVLALSLASAACASRSRVPPPGAGTFDAGPLGSLIETPASPRAANDIPESQRIKWFEDQVTQSDEGYRPTEYVERERDVVYVDRGYWRDPWYSPVSLSLGFWGGSGWGHRRHHRGHGGFGWGLGWGSGWGW